MEGDLKKVLNELDRLLIIARNAGMRMRLQDERENLRLPSETREFAWELSEGTEWGGSFTRARDLIRSIYPKQNENETSPKPG
jgi:hypothetical protein